MASALLIDDDVDLIESVKRAASAARLDLVTATTWDEGLGLFHVLSPNLVIADYNMPGSRHGLMLLARIRRLRPSVRLILVSGYLDEDDMDRVRELNIVDRALTKGSGVETARAIVDEVRQAERDSDLPTDWVSVAHAFVDAAAVSDEDLERLDQILVRRASGHEVRPEEG
jgi:CheY-like chemotaxis protein